MIVDFTDRRDNRCSTAHSALNKIRNFLQEYLTLLNLHVEIMLCNIDNGTAGDRRQDARRLRNDELVVLCDKDNIRSACFFNLRACRRVEIEILCKALFMSLNTCIKAHCIVKTCLNVACSVRCSTVKITNFNHVRFKSALIIRTYRHDDDAELVFIRRLNPDNRTGREHVRTDVESSSRAVGRNEISVCLYYLVNSLYEFILRERRHLKTLSRIIHALSVEVRTEAYDIAVLCCVRLESFKAGLGILQNAGTLAHNYHRVSGEAALLPFSILVVTDITLVSYTVFKTDISPVDVLLCHT